MRNLHSSKSGTGKHPYTPPAIEHIRIDNTISVVLMSVPDTSGTQGEPPGLPDGPIQG